MTNKEITLVSTIYEANFRQHLKENSWFRKFESKYITKKRLIINNLISTQELEDILNELYDPSEVEIVYVEDHSDRVIEKYKLNIDKNHPAYNFCVPYFVNIDTCKTPYFFNVSTDCCIDIHIDDDYFEKSIDLLENHPEYSVKGLATIPSHCKYSPDKSMQHPTHEVGEWGQMNCVGYTEERSLEHFWVCNLFSDQVFVGKVDNFKKVDWNAGTGSYLKPPEPPYTYEAFECKVTDYLRHNDSFIPLYKSKTTYFIHSGHIPGSNIK
jgi:hypothetical protein